MSLPSSSTDMTQIQNNLPQGTSSRPAHSPPFTGFIETTYDALLVFEAGRRGLIPRVTRRLTEDERSMVKSGAVFIFDESESGIKRWTDGLIWSPSRILGNFLVYRETDKRNAGGQDPQSATMPPPLSSDLSVPRPDQSPFGTGALQRPRSQSDGGNMDRNRERQLVGSLTSSYRFREGGLIKKTISVFVNGYAQHLVSYYTLEDALHHKLRTPSTVPELAALEISADFLSKQNFRFPPQIEVGVDGIPRYRGEPDIPPSPSHGVPPIPYPMVPFHDVSGHHPAPHPVYEHGPPPQYQPYTHRQSTGGAMRPTSASRRMLPYGAPGPHGTHSPRTQTVHMPSMDRRSSQSSLHSVSSMPPVEYTYAAPPPPNAMEIPHHARMAPIGPPPPMVHPASYSPRDTTGLALGQMRDMPSAYIPRDQTHFQPGSLPAPPPAPGHVYLDANAPPAPHSYALPQMQVPPTPTTYSAPPPAVGTPHPSLSGWQPSPQQPTSSPAGSSADWRSANPTGQDVL